jgi:predicted transcriptional regulator
MKRALVLVILVILVSVTVSVTFVSADGTERTINVGETLTIDVDGTSYKVSLSSLSDDASPKASVIVNGESRTLTQDQTKSVEGVNVYARTIFRTGENSGYAILKLSKLTPREVQEEATINVGETLIFNVDGVKYTVSLNSLSDEATPKASVSVGTDTSIFTQGQTKSIGGVSVYARTVFRTGEDTGYAILKLKKMGHREVQDEATVNVGETLIFNVGGVKYTVSLNGISDEETPKASVSVDGETRTLAQGQSKSVEGATILVRTVFRTGDNSGYVIVKLRKTGYQEVRDKATINIGETLIFNVDGIKYKVTLTGISDEKIQKASVSVNGETKTFVQGQIITMSGINVNVKTLFRAGTTSGYAIMYLSKFPVLGPEATINVGETVLMSIEDDKIYEVKLDSLSDSKPSLAKIIVNGEIKSLSEKADILYERNQLKLFARTVFRTGEHSGYVVVKISKIVVNEIEPSEETGPVDLPEETEEDVVTLCQGCELDSKCYPIGYRKGGEFCSDSVEFVEQGEEETSCENNFECKSNVCVDGECVSSGLIRAILNFFKRLFGGG